MSWHETTRNSTSESKQCRIIRVSASSWNPLRALMSIFVREHLTVSSSSNPPPTMMILLAVAPAISFSERKRATSTLFSSRARKLDQDLVEVRSHLQ